MAAKECLEDFNSKHFQKREGSRKEVFLKEEKEFLRPLPKTPYEYATTKKATVQYNYHISVDKMYYSVPHEYIKKKVDVRITKHIVEVYYEHTRICSHTRLYGRPGQYSTNMDHMPTNHQKAMEWNGDRFRKWAKSIGSNTYTVIDKLLIENACKIALDHLSVPRYKNIKLIIQNNQDNIKESEEVNNDYAIVRGASYYGKNNE